MPVGVKRPATDVHAGATGIIIQRLLRAGHIPAVACASVAFAGCSGITVAEDATTQPGRRTNGIPPQATTYVYECGDSYTFVARMEGQTAWLFLPSGTVRLPQASSGSGAKYSEGQVTLWSKGEQAMLEVGEGVRRSCTNNRAMAIWEDAKFRGVDFRAVGNEPGWYLEISENGETVFVGDYGQTEYRFATPEPSVDQRARSTTYAVKNRQEVVIVLQGWRCRDTMSGELFETTVTVVSGGKTYRGCGRALH